jgi:citrate lyase subunit beta / citryl-CoA lyase
MRRSLLFIPANSPAMLQNADIFQSDGVIFDLEDAVMLSEKDAAVHLLDNFLKSFAFENLEIVVRINPLDSEFSKTELEQIVSDKIDTIMLPKATAKNTTTLSKLLDKLEKSKKMNKKIGIIPIIELASSVLEVQDIASIHRVNGLLLGGEDLATDLEVERTEGSMELLLSRGLVVLAAKAYKLDAIDTPYTKTNDEEGLNKDSTLAKLLGMNAKVCIHPNQIETVNTVFSPSIQDIEYARKVVKAEADASSTGKGAFTVDGKMIDKPIIIRAKKLLEKAQRWGLL